MAKRKITNRDLRVIEDEYGKWKEICNVGVGTLSFALSIACIGTPCPGVWAWVSIAFVLVMLHHFQKYFPKKIRKLRAKELEGMDELTLLGIEKKYFGLKAAFMGFGGYFFGLVFLVLLATGGSIFLECDIVPWN